MSRYQRRQNSIADTLKDYLVPIIWGILLLLLFWSIFSGDTTSNTPINENENRTPTNITFITPETEAFIVYPGDNTEPASNNSSLYKWESVIVKEWTVIISPNDSTDITLNKIAELKYEDTNSYALYSSDAWIESDDTLSIAMRYASVSTGNNSVVSLTQNEAVSTIYVLAWSAKVTNLWGSTTSLIKGQKVSVSRQDAAKWDIDLASEKAEIDSYFKSSDWFIENEGYITLQKEETTDSDTTLSWSTLTGDSSWRYINFDNLSDEASVSTSSLDISGTIVSESVGALTIDGKQADILSDNSFSIDGIILNSSVNDLIVKVYDTNQNILEKKVYTIYTSEIREADSANISIPTSSSSSGGSNPNNITSFDVDGTDFGFTAPSVTGKFSTSGSEITIRGITTAEDITGVQVNGFDLASFNGSTWRYHAFTRFDTLVDGTNQYKVDYFRDGKIVYTDYYTIVKKDVVESVAPVTPSNDTVEETNEDEEILEEPETAL